jgi:hypothetical protein
MTKELEDVPYHQQAPHEFVWITRIGEPVAVGSMGDRHLVNTHAFAGRQLHALQEEHAQRRCDNNILGDNPNGFTGLEDRIAYMQAAIMHTLSEIERRGLTPRPAQHCDAAAA